LIRVEVLLVKKRRGEKPEVKRSETKGDMEREARGKELGEREVGAQNERLYDV
jgi:hypothetical protein